jgi:hypothetical protein
MSLRNQKLSMRGVPVDFGALRASNPEKITLGNTRKNVRGDLLGENNTVIKTHEQIEAEWARTKAMQQAVTQSANIKANVAQNPPPPAPATAKPAETPADVAFPTIGELAAQGGIQSTPAKKKAPDAN